METLLSVAGRDWAGVVEGDGRDGECNLRDETNRAAGFHCVTRSITAIQKESASAHTSTDQNRSRCAGSLIGPSTYTAERSPGSSHLRVSMGHSAAAPVIAEHARAVLVACTALALYRL
jgi:hypothetical protein